MKVLRALVMDYEGNYRIFSTYQRDYLFIRKKKERYEALSRVIIYLTFFVAFFRLFLSFAFHAANAHESDARVSK